MSASQREPYIFFDPPPLCDRHISKPPKLEYVVGISPKVSPPRWHNNTTWSGERGVENYGYGVAFAFVDGG